MLIMKIKEQRTKTIKLNLVRINGSEITVHKTRESAPKPKKYIFKGPKCYKVSMVISGTCMSINA